MNLFCVIPAEDDATSFYRALQPIAQLRRIIPNLNIKYHGAQIKSSDLADRDVVFLQRPSGEEHLKLIELCNRLHVKVWSEYDDNLFCVPKSNPAHYDADKSKETVRKIIAKSDVVSVSTKQLGLDLSQEFKADKQVKIHVIPNAFNDFILKEKPVFKPHNVVMWRGTQSHQEDLLTFGHEIVEAAKANPSWFFNFIGYNPFFLVERMGKQSAHSAPMDIHKYHEYIQKIYPNLAIVTLSDSPFNRCKSNIAWLEATYAGAVTVGPSWEEWQKPGIVSYHDVQSFHRSLDSLLKTPHEQLKKFHALSWEYINDKLMLSKVNQLRKNLLEEVLS